MKLLQPIRSEKIWGYEDWLASTHKDGLQKDFLELAGDYPLLVKVIQANATLSVQVHPDDKTALLLEGAGSRGKTECWYILDCEKGARLIAGLKDGCTKDQIEQAIKDNTLQDLMNSVEVKKGDFIFIPAGTVHAIGGKIRLMEVQQSCNLTYRLYDWGRPRELHLEKGIKSIKLKADTEGCFSDGKPFRFSPAAPLPENFECPYFSLANKTISGGYSFLASKDSGFELLFITEAEKLKASCTATDGTKTVFEKIQPEQIYAVAPGEKITLEGRGKIIRIKPVQTKSNP